MVSDHESPGGERHELPANKEREGIVGQHNQIHACEKGGKKWQDSMRGGFMMPVSESYKACSSTGETDEKKKKCGERTTPKVPSEPRQADRQHQRSGIRTWH